MMKYFFLLLLTLNLRAASDDAIISGWLAKQTNIHSWSADFTQTRTLKALAQPLVSTGQVWFAAPQNFRWELGRDQTAAIRNDNTMLVLYPRLQRAERYQFDGTTRSEWKDALSLLQSGFPRSREELDRQFNVVSITETNSDKDSTLLVHLEPKSTGARKMMPRINLFLSPDLTLAGTELVFIDGSRMRNDFSNTKMNADVTDKFSLSIPEGFKLVEPMKGHGK